MAKSMSIKLEFVAPLPQIAITRFTYNAVEFYGPQGPRYKEVVPLMSTHVPTIYVMYEYRHYKTLTLIKLMPLTTIHICSLAIGLSNIL